jgi:uncharacterized coiled-coil protein SlyX
METAPYDELHIRVSTIQEKIAIQDSMIEVLNRRLFKVEANVEQLLGRSNVNYSRLKSRACNYPEVQAAARPPSLMWCYHRQADYYPIV